MIGHLCPRVYALLQKQMCALRIKETICLADPRYAYTRLILLQQTFQNSKRLLHYTSASTSSWLQADTTCTVNRTESTTSQELNSAAVFRANLTGLFPDVNYTVKVYPYNEAGEGSVDEKTNTTHQERKSWDIDGENDKGRFD